MDKIQDIILPLYSFKQWSEIHTLLNYIIFIRNMNPLDSQSLSEDQFHNDYPLLINCSETNDFVVQSKTKKFVCEKIELLFEYQKTYINFLGKKATESKVIEKWVLPVYYIRQNNPINLSENRLPLLMRYIHDNIMPIVERLEHLFIIDNPNKNTVVKQRVHWMKDPSYLKQMVKSVQSLALDTLFSSNFKQSS